jgi:cell division protein FtsQ
MGHLSRSLNLPRAGSRTRRPSPRTGAHAGARGQRALVFGLRRAVLALRLPRAWRATATLLRAHRRVRIALVALLAALPLLGGGWLWLRGSSLVAVEHVRLSGVSGPESGAIETALTSAARRMTTLDVREGALLAAVAPFRVVRALHIAASFPHRLSIRVVEQPPVAALTVGSLRTAVAADGVVLGPALLRSPLPTISAGYEPATGGRLHSPSVLAALRVLAAAPAPLAALIARVYEGPKGLTVAMRSGLLAYFGDASRPHAKWLSLARVLADPGSAGASYVDVRLPERPAAGFPAGVAPPARSSSETASASGEGTENEQAAATEEATVAALAAGLASSDGSATASSATGGEAASGEGESTSGEGETASAGAESTAGDGASGASAQAPSAASEAPALAASSGEGTRAEASREAAPGG